jgi:penicillin-binding protein 2
LLNGDIANLSIGQGDTQATPLQMAQAFAIIGNGGTMYQTRLVQQVQTVDNEIVTAFQVREKKTLGASADTIAQLRTGLINAVNAGAGTAHQSSLENVEVAGKTGTAQWGPKHKERTAAWFAGFVPADKPQLAFAAVYEGDVGASVHGGSHAAPMIGMILKDVYKENGNKKRRTTEPPVKRAEPVEEDGD